MKKDANYMRKANQLARSWELDFNRKLNPTPIAAFLADCYFFDLDTEDVIISMHDFRKRIASN